MRPTWKTLPEVRLPALHRAVYPLYFLTETRYDNYMKNEILYYYLTFTDNGCDCDGEQYTVLDEARDVAFEWSAETNRRVGILECFGVAENLVESVLA